MVSSSLTDPNFYTAVPEFLTLQPNLKALNVSIKPGGCTSCAKRRVETNMYKSYLTVVQSLDANAVQRLKSYFKVDQLLINAVDPANGTFIFKTI